MMGVPDMKVYTFVNSYQDDIVCVLCVCAGEWELKAPDWAGAMEEDQYLVIPVIRSHDPSHDIT